MLAERSVPQLSVGGPQIESAQADPEPRRTPKLSKVLDIYSYTGKLEDYVESALDLQLVPDQAYKKWKKARVCSDWA